MASSTFCCVIGGVDGWKATYRTTAARTTAIPATNGPKPPARPDRAERRTRLARAPPRAGSRVCPAPTPKPGGASGVPVPGGGTSAIVSASRSAGSDCLRQAASGRPVISGGASPSGSGPRSLASRKSTAGRSKTRSPVTARFGAAKGPRPARPAHPCPARGRRPARARLHVPLGVVVPPGGPIDRRTSPASRSHMSFGPIPVVPSTGRTS